VIVQLSFEEVTTLNSAVERMLSPGDGGGVVAPPEVLAELEARLPLRGDISVNTLAKQVRLVGAVGYVMEHLKRRMDALVVERYVGDDDAVNAYFDYANILTLHTRLTAVGREMRAMIQLMTGGAVTDESARSISFPD
jgi:hypothetical protein